jgi:hypothetical protein
MLGEVILVLPVIFSAILANPLPLTMAIHLFQLAINMRFEN